MPKTFNEFMLNVTEWSSPTAHTARVTQRISVATGKSSKAKKPSVIQPTQLPISKSEKKRRGIHFFQLDDAK